LLLSHYSGHSHEQWTQRVHAVRHARPGRSTASSCTRAILPSRTAFTSLHPRCAAVIRSTPCPSATVASTTNSGCSAITLSMLIVDSAFRIAARCRLPHARASRWQTRGASRDDRRKPKKHEHARPMGLSYALSNRTEPGVDLVRYLLRLRFARKQLAIPRIICLICSNVSVSGKYV